jgi:hypothetical protein
MAEESDKRPTWGMLATDIVIGQERFFGPSMPVGIVCVPIICILRVDVSVE